MILRSSSFFTYAVVTVDLHAADLEARSICVCGATLHESDGPAAGPADEFECGRGHKWLVQSRDTQDPKQLHLPL